jgi:hypothetical protein
VRDVFVEFSVDVIGLLSKLQELAEKAAVRSWSVAGGPVLDRHVEGEIARPPTCIADSSPGSTTTSTAGGS